MPCSPTTNPFTAAETPAVGVAIEGLTKVFGRNTVLSDLSFTIAAGEIFVLMGPSGSGKSVLLKHIVGLEKPARALVMEPQLLLYDEPTSELDPVMSATISEIIATLRQEYHVTSIVVSHDRALALTIADRVGILMQGKLRILGTPAELRASADPVITDFLNPQIDLHHPRFKQLESTNE
jgi:ABC-type transporter Mla maintaining outer membrane lipid asymmetry ATPase subunit MlaF